MAAPAPLVPVVVPAAALGNPLFDEDPVYLPAGHSLVAATSTFVQWQPVAAAANAPAQQVAAPFFALLYAFGIRCKEKKVSSSNKSEAYNAVINPSEWATHWALRT